MVAAGLHGRCASQRLPVAHGVDLHGIEKASLAALEHRRLPHDGADAELASPLSFTVHTMPTPDLSQRRTASGRLKMLLVHEL